MRSISHATLSECDSGDVAKPTFARRPRLRAGLTVVRRGDETHVHSARIDAFTALEDPDGVWLALLEGCTGERDLTALRRDLSAAGHGLEPADVRAGVDALTDAGFLVDGAADLDDSWANQRAYLEQFATPEADAEQMLASVRATRALILGAGGVGSWLAHSLTLMGVRELVVVDPDRVDAANLTRQLYPRDAVGVRKIEALGAALQRLRPDVGYRGIDLMVTEADDLAALLDGVDVVAGCADHPTADDAAELVATACVPLRIPHTIAAYAGPVARVGPTWLPRRRPVACHGCLRLVHEREDAEWSTTAEEARRLKPRRAAVTVVQAQLVAALAATEILHLRAGLVPATAGHVVAVDLRTLRSYRSRVARQRDCSLCGAKMSVTSGGDRRPAPATRREEVRV
jgi:molybdopterin-synthase adenylyltransferase